MLFRSVFPASLRRAGLRAWRAERGSIAVHVALMSVMLIGVAALGVEVTSLLVAKRKMQAAADSAAMAAANGLISGGTTRMVTDGRAVAAVDGFVNGARNATVSVASPATQGGYAGVANSIEVVISQPQHMQLMQLFRSGDVMVKARATATVTSGGRYCLLALHPSASQAVFVNNNAIITNPACGAAVNSSSASGLWLNNNSIVSGPVSVHGSNIYLGSNAYVSNRSVIKNGPIFSDPYAAANPGTMPGCTSQSGSGSGIRTLSPGHFCSGWNFGNGAIVTLQPGVYFVDSGLALQNNVVLNGQGVTIVMNGTYMIDLGNGVVANLTAPTSGGTAGIVFFGPRNGSTAQNQIFQNNAIMNVTGAFYFPSQKITFKNNGIVQSAVCTQVIAQLIEVANNLQLNNNCFGTGITALGVEAAMVE